MEPIFKDQNILHEHQGLLGNVWLLFSHHAHQLTLIGLGLSWLARTSTWSSLCQFYSQAPSWAI
jgi:hypothetical protein